MIAIRHGTNDTECTGRLISSRLTLCMRLYFCASHVSTSRHVYTCSELKSKWHEVKATVRELARPLCPTAHVTSGRDTRRETATRCGASGLHSHSYSDPSTLAPPRHLLHSGL